MAHEEDNVVSIREAAYALGYRAGMDALAKVIGALAVDGGSLEAAVDALRTLPLDGLGVHERWALRYAVRIMRLAVRLLEKTSSPTSPSNGESESSEAGKNE